MFWTVVLKKTLESSLDCKEIKAVSPKGNQSWIFIGKTDAEAPILWPPDSKNWLTGKDSNAGKEWRWEEKGTTEDEMAGWHHWLNRHEFEQAPGVGDGQGGLSCCSQWSRKELDMTEWLSWTELNFQGDKMFVRFNSLRLGEWLEKFCISINIIIYLSCSLRIFSPSWAKMTNIHFIPQGIWVKTWLLESRKLAQSLV